MYKDRTYYLAYCQSKIRNRPQKKEDSDEDESKKTKSYNDPKNYPSFYRFLDEGLKTMRLIGHNGSQNHEPGFTEYTLGENIVRYIESFPKRRKIVDVVTHLEQKYKRTFNYDKVRYFFRVTNLFGPHDYKKFIEFLQQKSAFVKCQINDKDKSMTRLFATVAMINNYKLFSDFLLIDATYQTNQYQIPLLVFSGITAEGKNTLFGLWRGLLNVTGINCQISLSLMVT